MASWQKKSENFAEKCECNSVVNCNENESPLPKMSKDDLETNGPLCNGYEETDDRNEQYNRLHNGVDDLDGHQLTTPVKITAQIPPDEDWEKDLREEHPYTEDLMEMSKTTTYFLSRPDDAYCPGDRHAGRIKWRKQPFREVAGQFDDEQYEQDEQS